MTTYVHVRNAICGDSVV